MNIDVDDILLDKIERAVANGCSTSKEIASTLGINHHTFRSIKDGMRKNGKEESSLISQAIKKGEARQPLNMLPLVELSMMKGTQGYYVEEVDTETTDSDIHGTTTKTKVKKKYIAPNTALLIYVANNLSRRLDKSGQRQWMNEQSYDGIGHSKRNEVAEKDKPDAMTDSERQKRILELRDKLK